MSLRYAIAAGALLDKSRWPIAGIRDWGDIHSENLEQSAAESIGGDGLNRGKQAERTSWLSAAAATAPAAPDFCAAGRGGHRLAESW
jgi:hypothetical protein